MFYELVLWKRSSPFLVLVILPLVQDDPSLLLLSGLGGDLDQVSERFQKAQILLIN